MSAARAAVPALLALLWAAPGAAHHVGTYVPKDNAVSANFKEIKFALQAPKLDVARRLFERGALRREMGAQAATLPPGLEARTLAAFRAGDAREAEGHLVVFFAALARDLAREAVRQLGAPGITPVARAATGPKFLEAIWRYYNLVDFAVSSRDNKSSTAVRLAFDEAEGYVKTTSASEADKLREPLRRIAQLLSTVIDTSSALPRRDS